LRDGSRKAGNWDRIKSMSSGMVSMIPIEEVKAEDIV